MAKRKLILDVDTGTDDAVAVMLAALHPALDLVGCTTVNGNVEVQYCTDNTLRVLDHVGRKDIPVYEGLARPLIRPTSRSRAPPATSRERSMAGPCPCRRASRRKSDVRRGRVPGRDLSQYHGRDHAGAGGAVDQHRDGADALSQAGRPGAGDRHHGRRHEIGNVTPSAEFNIWGDPEAAAVVFAAKFRKMTLVPLDATHRALVSYADCEKLRALGTPAGSAAADFIGHRIHVHDEIQRMAVAGTTPVHDAVCVGYLVDPAIITTRAGTMWRWRPAAR
jgi:inosine-uridine nucleoside N-ribohydrolase